MLNVTPLADGEYLISSVALGVDEYYLGAGEAPGVWQGRWAASLGLNGTVEADDLRALIEGRHPATGADLLGTNRKRAVFAFDATFSCPKSVSLLWAFGTDDAAAVVARAHVEAVATALSFLEEKAAVARRQEGGVRHRVGTDGFAVATFVHRTSREGDPQLHTHCLIPNVVRRADGAHVAFNAHPLHEWRKAAGSLFQSELRRHLTRELGVKWGPDRNGCREMVGFSREQLRTFSKRTAQIEAELERRGGHYRSDAERMKANDRVALDTRRPKDRRLTPALLAQAWQAEARSVGLDRPERVEALVVGRDRGLPALDRDQVFARLVDAEQGVCSRRARFTEAHVHEAVCAMSEGQWDAARVRELAGAFLASAHAVRLAPAAGAEWCQSPRWSTAEHRALEDHVLGRLDQLADRHDTGVEAVLVEQAIARHRFLGHDQAEGLRRLCEAGPAVRALIAPAGHGKTTAVQAAAEAHRLAGRHVLGLATTNKAVEELAVVGLNAMTIARLRLELRESGLAPGAVLVVDEVSQVSTRDAAAVLDAAAVTPGASVWFLGDPRQGTSVAAGGIAAEIARRGRDDAIVAPQLVENRRQVDPADREALSRLRAGRAAESQAIRAGQGWEHEHATPDETRNAMAEAVVADIGRYGADAVAALAVSHHDCEDLADRIRARLIEQGQVARSGIRGRGWSADDRTYAAGDRILLHATFRDGPTRLHNGSVGTVLSLGPDGLGVRFASGDVALPMSFLAGTRPDGMPNLSHAWARTVDGAEGGTWDVVHLLGTGGLDALRGYVGQSRSRAPTHTWNVRPEPALDHGGVVVDDRDGAEQVLAALKREPDVTFAGIDDPWPVDRRLRAEQAQHREMLARCPQDRVHELAEAEVRQHKASFSVIEAGAELSRARQALKELGRLQIRASGRAERAAAEERVDRAETELSRWRAAVRNREAVVQDLAARQAERQEFLQREGWRADRIGAIDRLLSEHWAPVVLACVRNDQPLAFGLDRLRDARLFYAAKLRHLTASLPPDRTEALGDARRQLSEANRSLTEAKTTAASAARDLDEARRRHWGRRDRDAIEQATRHAAYADTRQSSAGDCVGSAQQAVEREANAVQERRLALAANRETLDDLGHASQDLDRAVERVRAERVVAMARGAELRSHLAELREPPKGMAGLQVWCGVAWEVESWRDDHPSELGMEDADPALGNRPDWYADRLAWDGLSSRIARTPKLVAIAEHLGLDEPVACISDPTVWSARLNSAVMAHRAADVLEREPLGLDLGR